MEKTIQAVYESGVLRPLEPLELSEQQEVTVFVSDETASRNKHPLLVSSEEWSAAAGDAIALEEVRRALSSIRGSLATSVISERRER